MFIGRAAQVEHLVGELASEESAGQLVCLRGDAGAGKSRTIDTVVDELTARGIPVLLVRPDSGLKVTFPEILLRAIQDYFESYPDHSLIASVARLAKAVARYGRDPRGAHLALIHEICSVADVLAAGRRTVVVLDDLDLGVTPASFGMAVHRLSLGGSTVLVSTRATGAALSAVTRATAVPARVVELEPLAETELVDLIARAMRARPSQALIAALCAAVGVPGADPAAVLAVLRCARAEGAVREVDGHLVLTAPAAALRLPASQVAMRTGRLDAAEHAVLTGIAVLDGVERADLTALAEAAGLPFAECGGAVDAFVRTGTLRMRDGVLRFAMPALGRALAHECEPAEVARMHAVLAKRLAPLVAAGARERDAELADHLTCARTPVDGVDVPAILVRAAGTVRASDPRRAVPWCLYAIECTEPADPLWTTTVRSTVALLRELGCYEQLLALALEVLERGADPELSVEVVLHGALAAVHLDRADQLGVLADRVGSSAEDVTRLFLQDYLAALLDGRGHASNPWGSALADSLVLAAAVTGTAWRRDANHPLRTWFTAWRRDKAPAVVADAWRAMTHGDVASVLELTGGPACGAADGVMAVYGALRSAYCRGDWDDALHQARRVLVRAAKPSAVVATTRALVAQIRAHRGEANRVVEWLDGVEPAWPTDDVLAAARCAILHALGRSAEACIATTAVRRRLMDDGRVAGLDELTACLAEAAVGAGSQAEAEELLAELETSARQHTFPLTQPLLARVRAVVTGSPDAAEDAVQLLRPLGQPHDLARACLLAGTVHADPEPLLREAQNLFRDLRSPSGRAEVARAMRAKGVAVPRHRARADSLSTTEVRIAALVSDGMTNRQIAARLQVSEKTVEGYLTRLFTKTGCRSRVQLTAAHVSGQLAIAS